MASNSGGPPSAGNPLARLVKASAAQVWQAGRGAYLVAGSGSSRLVGSLLDMGGRIDRTAKRRVVGARDTATQAWGQLENAFVQRVAHALNALQIPTARDIHELNIRVASLQRAVIALERRAAQARGKTDARGKRTARSRKKAPAHARAKAGS